MQKQLQLKNTRLTPMPPTILQIPKEIPKEHLLLHAIAPRRIHTDLHHQRLCRRRVLKTMVRALGQMDDFAGLLHDLALRRVSRCRLVPDSGAGFDEEIFGLEEVEMLGWIEKGFIVGDVVGYKVR